ncbi:OmpP1/FadL family transporter [Legionella sp. km772]|uniref:OmpP1/FadL family transporter n=1 Tax=Legionella sp. km772 TaxID=2498111 RepID=UPI000F8C5C03|nr:outer membrane protein transport protein [Legionella sp. km772]RUR13897.1 transporter [Legionella sp. km772]
MHKPLRTIVSTAVLGILAASAAHAGSFALYTESSPAAIGNYAAGIAAEAADASIGWYNPAGLPLLREQQVTFGGVGVFPSTKLSGTSTFTTVTETGLPALFPPSITSIYPQAYSGIQGAENGFVPSVHYALPLGESATFGFSVVSPFGLSTDWGLASPVRYQATKSELITANFSPELGAKITNNFSLGAGLDLQYARVKFNRVLGIPTFLSSVGANPFADDSLSYNKGKSFGVGFHVGAMGMFNDNHTRIGLNYQSKMRHKFNGYSQLSGPLATPATNLFLEPVSPPSIILNNNLSSNSIEFPDVLTLSAYHDLNEKIALLGSVVYTGWSCFDSIQLNNVAAPNVNVSIPTQTATVSQVSVSSTSLQNYRDTWRAAIGANYKFNDIWMLRVGGGYDQTPTNNVYRDIRLPDADRWALSVGAHYQARANVGIDVGYTHLFAVNDPVVNRTDPLAAGSTYNVDAIGSVSADLVGAQVVWKMDQPAVMPMPTK